jgi:hypothetical protein
MCDSSRCKIMYSENSNRRCLSRRIVLGLHDEIELELPPLAEKAPGPPTSPRFPETNTTRTAE